MYLFRLGLSSNPYCQVATEVRNSRGQHRFENRCRVPLNWEFLIGQCLKLGIF